MLAPFYVGVVACDLYKQETADDAENREVCACSISCVLGLERCIHPCFSLLSLPLLFFT